jgi:hypothetical protein
MMFDRRRKLGHLPAFFLRPILEKKRKKLLLQESASGLILMTAGRGHCPHCDVIAGSAGGHLEPQNVKKIH